MKLATLAALFLYTILTLLTACSFSQPASQSTGILQGHVTIGPLVPVQQVGEADPIPAPEVYAARQIVIFSADGQTEIARAEIDAEGNYSIELPTEVYQVDINRIGIDFAYGLPAFVTIVAGGITLLDVDIDTGMR